MHRPGGPGAGPADGRLIMDMLANRQFSSRGPQSPQTSSLIDDLEPTYREILFAAVMVLWFLMGMTAAPPGSEDTINTIGLIAFSILLAWAAYHQMKRNTASLWTPLLWYRVATMSYFGIGSLVPIWINGETLDLMKGFYAFFGYEIVKLNLLITVFNLVFIFTIKIVFIIMRRNDAFRKIYIGNIISPSNLDMIVFGSISLTVGSLVNYFVVFPQTVGLINLSAYATLAQLSILGWIGYFMVIYWGLQNRRPGLVLLAIVLALGESAIGFFQMSKAFMLMPIVMVGVAFIYHRRTLPRIAIFITFFVSLFMTLTPLVGYVRLANMMYYSGAAPFTEVPKIYISYFTDGSDPNRYSDTEDGWMRLSFVNAATFVINQYDHGMPGTSYRYWSIVWIPRAIYPSKPIITDVARELSYAANGNYNSSSSAGLAAEAYWNGGWVATIGIAIIVALILGSWSIYSFVVIQRKAWHLFFIFLIGMRMSIRVDGAFVSDILGPIALVIGAHIALELMNRFLPQAFANATRRKPVLR